MATAGSIRERNRADLTRAILVEGRRQLARDGAAGLSLRSVARELGMASSAVYRYVANRDDLLTLLIVDAYDAVGAALEKADAALEPADVRRRWDTAATTLRSWALKHPHQYSLIYGSPVPGYAAPQSTVASATRAVGVLARIVRDARPAAVPGDPVPPASVRADLRAVQDGPLLDGSDLDETVLTRALMAWTALFGLVSFELGGQFTNVITDLDAWYAHCVRLLADQIGLPAARRRRNR